MSSSEELPMSPSIETGIVTPSPEERIGVSGQFLETLRLTRRRIVVLNLLTRLLILVLLIGLGAKYFVLDPNFILFKPLTLFSEVVVSFAVILASLGMGHYTKGLKKFLSYGDRMHLHAMIWTYRAMWAKLGISAVLLLMITGVNLADALLFPPLRNTSGEIIEYKAR